MLVKVFDRLAPAIQLDHLSSTPRSPEATRSLGVGQINWPSGQVRQELTKDLNDSQLQQAFQFASKPCKSPSSSVGFRDRGVVGRCMNEAVANPLIFFLPISEFSMDYQGCHVPVSLFSSSFSWVPVSWESGVSHHRPPRLDNISALR